MFLQCSVSPADPCSVLVSTNAFPVQKNTKKHRYLVIKYKGQHWTTAHVRPCRTALRTLVILQGTLRSFGIMSKAKGGMYGDTLSDRDKLLQVKLVAGCLSAGIPLHALGDPQMKAFFDFANIGLPGDNHLAEHIPFLLSKEVRLAARLVEPPFMPKFILQRVETAAGSDGAR